MAGIGEMEGEEKGIWDCLYAYICLYIYFLKYEKHFFIAMEMLVPNLNPYYHFWRHTKQVNIVILKMVAENLKLLSDDHFNYIIHVLFYTWTST